MWQKGAESAGVATASSNRAGRALVKERNMGGGFQLVRSADGRRSDEQEAGGEGSEDRLPVLRQGFGWDDLPPRECVGRRTVVAFF